MRYPGRQPRHRKSKRQTIRVIKPSAVREHAERHPQAEPALENWLRLAEGAAWKRFDHVRKTFPHADQVIVKSKRPVVVFNIAGNNFRLITAIHFNTAKLFVLRFLTHAEYDKDKWKEQL